MPIRLLVALSLALCSCEYADMGLPTSREETATPASPVSSNTTNAIQDAIIGAKFKPRWHWFNGLHGAWTSGVSDFSRSSAYWLTSTTNANASYGFPFLYVGCRVLGIGMRYRGAAAATDVELTFEESNGPAGGANYLYVARSDAGGNAESGILKYTAADHNGADIDTINSPIVIQDGWTYGLEWNPHQTDVRLYALGLYVDCP